MKDPVVSIAHSGFDRFLEIMGACILLFLWILAIYSFITLQQIIPIHFDAKGTVNKWGEKTTLLFFPATATIIYFGLSLVTRSPGVLNTINWNSPNAPLQVKFSLRALRALKASIALVFCIIIGFTHQVLNGQPSPLGPWLLPAILFVILAPLGYYLMRLLTVR